MSVEVSTGAMSAGVGAVTGPASLGGEIGAGAVIAAPSIEMSGGSFVAGLNATSLFAETTPFSASAASVPEMSPANAGIFSDYSILGKAGVSEPSLAAAPVASSTDVLSGLGFEPYSPDTASVPETPLANPSAVFSGSWSKLGEISKSSLVDALVTPATDILSEGEWLSLVETPKEVESTLGSISVEPQGEAAEGITELQTEGLKTLTESLVVDERVQVLAEETIEQDKLAEKVVSLLVVEGVYSEAQARKRVGEIALQRKGLVEESVGEAAVEAKAGVKVEPVTQTSVQRVKVDTQKTQVGAQVEDKHSLPKNILERIPEQAAVVDEKAQAYRKKTVKEIISALFERARKVGFQKVDSRVITEALRKKQEHKSLLLTQLKIPHVPDGSLEEAAGAIEFLGELGVLSESDEGKMTDRIDKVLERNVPVKIANLTSQEVSEKEVKKVLKYAGTQVVLV